LEFCRLQEEMEVHAHDYDTHDCAGPKKWLLAMDLASFDGLSENRAGLVPRTSPAPRLG
jgi:hypothetical protein